MRGRGRERDLENAEEIERENEHDRAHRDDEIGIGELKGPGDFVSGGLERDHERREPNEPGEDAGGESEAIAKNARPAVAGVLDETENLERDHRQDTRHEVEDETADEAEKEELQQTSGDSAGAAIFAAAVAVTRQRCSCLTKRRDRRKRSIHQGIARLGSQTRAE